MTVKIPPEDLTALKAWPTCAISNAIELFDVRPRNEGFMLPEIECRFPEFEPMIGYAVTAVIRADAPGDGRIRMPDYWKEILKVPQPRIAVIQDLDDPVKGSFWGEVNANIHMALGCAGVVTDGSVRDLDEVKALGFHFFSRRVSVSHAYVHLVEVGGPVKVGGLTVRPGDLLMADKHGVLSVPPEIAGDLPRAARLVEAWERRVIEYCGTEAFSVEGLEERYLSPRPVWPPPQGAGRRPG